VVEGYLTEGGESTASGGGDPWSYRPEDHAITLREISSELKKKGLDSLVRWGGGGVGRSRKVRILPMI